MSHENKSNKEKKQSGIPIENENVSKDPTKSPKGDDTDKNIRDPKKGYVEPFNDKKPDPNAK